MRAAPAPTGYFESYEDHGALDALLALGDARATLEIAGVPRRLPTGEPDRGFVILGDGEVAAAIDDFVKAIGAHRHFAR